jgi:hypothetical protein
MRIIPLLASAAFATALIALAPQKGNNPYMQDVCKGAPVELLKVGGIKKGYRCNTGARTKSVSAPQLANNS